MTPSSVTRDFLLALLFNVRRDKYISLYNTYKEKKKQSSTTSGKIYRIKIEKSFMEQMNNYSSVSK